MSTAQRLLIPVILVLALFACVVLGILTFVPENELVAGFRAIFAAFAFGARAVLFVLAVSAVVIALAFAVLFPWRVLMAAGTARSRAKQAEAEALHAEREARLLITVAGPNQQVIATHLGTAVGQLPLYHTPLHLAAGRVNGQLQEPDPAQTQRWAYWNAIHASGGRGQGQPEVGQEPHLLATPWPKRVSLAELLPGGQATLTNIILGVSVDATGQWRIISAPLVELMHVLVGGSSGWGKSSFIKSFTYQIATAIEPAELALIDIDGRTFNNVAGSSRLRYPIAEDERAAKVILTDLQDEIERRKELFRRYPLVENLDGYNRVTDDPLPPITLVADETTVLLDDKAIEDLLKRVVLRARKWGIYTIAAGQSWKYNILDTAARDQFSTRIHFKADPVSSRVVLGAAVAATLKDKGRAWAILAGREMLEFQAPILEGVPALGDGKTTWDDEEWAERIDRLDGDQDEEAANADAHFVELVRAGKSRRAAAQEAYGREYAGDIVTRGKRALGELS